MARSLRSSGRVSSRLSDAVPGPVHNGPSIKTPACPDASISLSLAYAVTSVHAPLSPSRPGSESQPGLHSPPVPFGGNCSWLCCLVAFYLQHLFLRVGCSHICVCTYTESYLGRRSKHTCQGHHVTNHTPTISACGGTEHRSGSAPHSSPVLSSLLVRRVS